MKSWVEVSERRLVENYRAAVEVLVGEAGSAGASVLGVVKAHGYGHGAALCAPVLVRAGAEWLGVTDAAEGLAVVEALSENSLAARVLVMCGGLPEDAAAVVRHGLVPVVWTRAQMECLAAAVGEGEPLAVHVEIDTGMSRQGVAVGEGLRELLRWLKGEARLRLDGVMTHFAAAEVAGSAQTAEQRAVFEAALRMVAEAGLRPAWVHAGNTSVLDNGADGGGLRWLAGLAEGLGARAMVRVGIGLYGYCLPLEGLVASDGAEAVRLRSRIAPVMTWKTRVIGLSEVEAGAQVGYCGTFVAQRPMRLALLPVGYADGLRRELSCSTGGAGGWVLIGGRRAAMVGRVSMNLTTVDVTGMEVTVGDEVVLLGDGVTAEDHAALAGTIAYEIVCGVRAQPVLV